MSNVDEDFVFDVDEYENDDISHSISRQHADHDPRWDRHLADDATWDILARIDREGNVWDCHRRFIGRTEPLDPGRGLNDPQLEGRVESGHASHPLRPAHHRQQHTYPSRTPPLMDWRWLIETTLPQLFDQYTTWALTDPYINETLQGYIERMESQQRDLVAAERRWWEIEGVRSACTCTAQICGRCAEERGW